MKTVSSFYEHYLYIQQFTGSWETEGTLKPRVAHEARRRIKLSFFKIREDMSPIKKSTFFRRNVNSTQYALINLFLSLLFCIITPVWEQVLKKYKWKKMIFFFFFCDLIVLISFILFLLTSSLELTQSLFQNFQPWLTFSPDASFEDRRQVNVHLTC